MTDRCEIPRCKHPAAVFYLERGVCEKHWTELTADDVPPDKLKVALGIGTAATAMEEAMSETDSIAAEPAAAEETMGEKKASKPRAVKKTKAVKAKTKPAKAKPPKKERPPKEDLVVFACRVAEAERVAFHKATGPAGASGFARKLMVVFSNEDESAFRALLREARELRQ